MMRRVRVEEDKSLTVFEPTRYDNGGYRAEISVKDIDELRRIKAEGRLIGVRMTARLRNGNSQTNIVGAGEIEGL